VRQLGKAVGPRGETTSVELDVTRTLTGAHHFDSNPNRFEAFDDSLPMENIYTDNVASR
jgi:hypothetical protein